MAATKSFKPGDRVKVAMNGPGILIRIGDVQNYPKSATATVAFDSGKRFVTLARHLRAI